MSETGGSFWDGAASVLNGLANALRSTADDMAKTNAEFASSSGLTAKIERSTSGESCSWCSSIAGTYAYGSEPKDVYRRHDNCDCTVEYVTSKGSQNVHSKQWTKSTDKDTIKNRENPGRRTDISFDNDKFVIAEAKLTEYLPKPGGKHAAEFFDVGYSKEDKQVLLSDIYEQFDIESKSDVRELSDGSIRFSIEMQLGVTQKKPFVTGWIIDGSRAKPRFITAYRISKK